MFDGDYSFKPYGNVLGHIRRFYFDHLKKADSGYYHWMKEAFMGEVKSAGTPFTGKVYILTDGGNYSASTDFIQGRDVVKEYVFQLIGKEK